MDKMRPTYLCIEDIPDGPPKYVDIEEMQEQALIERIGLAMWEKFEKMEANHGS